MVARIVAPGSPVRVRAEPPFSEACHAAAAGCVREFPQAANSDYRLREALPAQRFPRLLIEHVCSKKSRL
jgi:hypothetical protein